MTTTEVPTLERELAWNLHTAMSEISFLALPLYLGSSLLGLLPGAPARPFSRYHLAQATLFHTSYFLISILTCGIGLLVLAFPVRNASRAAAEAARRGEWRRMPVTGGLLRPPDA